MIGATIYGEQSQNNHIILASLSRVYNSRHAENRAKEEKTQRTRNTFVRFSCKDWMDKNTFSVAPFHIMVIVMLSSI